MNDLIMNSNEVDLHKAVNFHYSDGVYLKDLNLHLKRAGSEMRITDMTNAMGRGECKVVCIDVCEFLNELPNQDLTLLSAWFEIKEGYMREGKKIYNPLKTFKKLTAKPAKWNKVSIIKALMTGQAKDLKCNSKYTDDYAYDVANNYGENKPVTNMAFFMTCLLMSSTGYADYGESNGRVYIRYGYNESYSFEFVM